MDNHRLLHDLCERYYFDDFPLSAVLEVRHDDPHVIVAFVNSLTAQPQLVENVPLSLPFVPLYPGSNWFYSRSPVSERVKAFLVQTRAREFGVSAYLSKPMEYIRF